MTRNHWMRLSAPVSVEALLGGVRGEQAGQSAASTARTLTLAPTESTAAMKDVPPPADKAAPTTGERKVTPPKPPAPTSFKLSAGTGFSASADDSITTRSARAGDSFTATVSENVKDAAGHVVIPAGARVSGTIVRADPAPNPRATGTLELSVSSVSVRGRSYSLAATVESKDTVMQGRGVTGADAAKVAGGAAIGALAGKLLGKNAKGAVIGHTDPPSLAAGDDVNLRLVVPLHHLMTHRRERVERSLSEAVAFQIDDVGEGLVVEAGCRHGIGE